MSNNTYLFVNCRLTVNIQVSIIEIKIQKGNVDQTKHAGKGQCDNIKHSCKTALRVGKVKDQPVKTSPHPKLNLMKTQDISETGVWGGFTFPGG